MALGPPLAQTPVDTSPQGLACDALAGETDVPASDGDTEVFTLRDWPALIDSLYSGSEIELDYDAYRYFERVLPLVWVNQPVRWPDGQVELANYGFADGSGPVIAFYRRWEVNGCHFFARNTGEMRT